MSAEVTLTEDEQNALAAAIAEIEIDAAFGVYAAVERIVAARVEQAEQALARVEADRDSAWRVAAQRRNEARRYYIAWQVARMRAAEKARDVERIVAARVEQAEQALARVEALADWHETKADKARQFRPEVNGENPVMDKAADVHTDAATRLRAALRGDR